ncbi:MAG TPA: cysteine desulfurase family protein [Rhizomicrobium sp.]|nr:cysteine desulfurase family protein [Rhizomicrobium sp.]
MMYWDHNATAPLRDEARAAMLRALEAGGNPSSVHAAGRAARAIVEEAREQVAAFAGARPSEVVFTSGGAESNALALRGAIAGALEDEDRITRLFVAATAHDSVRAVAATLAETVPGLKVSEIAVDADGRVDTAQFRFQLMNGKGRALVSLIFANNETGVIEEISTLAALLRKEAGEGALLHVDAVSSGLSPIRFAAWDADYLSLSAHKIGGPQGTGALAARETAPLAALFDGAQEMRRRAGTQNVPGIAGFGAAARALQANFDNEAQAASAARAAFEIALRKLEPNTVFFGEGAVRQKNVSCFAIPQLQAETTLIALDLDGICVSSGAACSSGKVAPSHVLAAMGVPESLARCALRVSFGADTTRTQIDAFMASVGKLLARKVALAG